MSRVVFDISISLDGFITGPNSRFEEPLGEGGEQLHEWAFGDDPRNRELMERAIAGAGAVITGRVTYDESIRYWGPNGPTGDARLPVFVVTHAPPAESPEGGVYTFVTDGVESALRRARAAANGKVVAVGGGAIVARQFLAAGLLDEVSLHVVPVLFGGGKRLFEELEAPVRLEPASVIDTPSATHLRYRVVR